MSDPITRVNAAWITVAGLLLLAALVVANSGPNATMTIEQTAVVDRESAGPVPEEPTTPTDAETGDPPPSTGCIRGGSTRAEVRAIMGDPDSVSYGAWVYGRSSVIFGYGTVLDYSNLGDNLILC